MSVVGIQKCGCITLALALADGEPLGREDGGALRRVIHNGGHIERMDDEVLRRHPHFLPSECPHEPKGWERGAHPSGVVVASGETGERSDSADYQRLF